jgi:hypothetical protein
MKVGDLVKYVGGSINHWDVVGVIIREIPGHAQVKVVRWAHPSFGMSSHAAADLGLVNSCRE